MSSVFGKTSCSEHGDRLHQPQLHDGSARGWHGDVHPGGCAPPNPAVLGLAVPADHTRLHALGGKLMNRKRQNERGAQIVEFAVVLPVLLLLALIVAKGANLIRVYQIVNNGAREGARLSELPQNNYQAVNSATGTSLTNPQTCTFNSSTTTTPHPVCQDVANYIRNNNAVG